MATAPQKTTSADGIAQIKAREGTKKDGERHVPYTDSVGKLTIGYGHLIQSNEKQALSSKQGIDEATAEALLAGDLAAAERAVNQRVTVEISQSQFDALVSFVFNTGTAKFTNAKSTLLRQLNQGVYAAVPAQMARWCKGVDPKTGKLVVIDGLAARRAAEGTQFGNAPPASGGGGGGGKGSEGKEGSEGTEQSEGTEESEHKEGKDHSEGSEGTEDSEGKEDSEGTEGSEGSEDSEGKEDSEGTEGSEGSEDSEGTEGSEGKEDSEGTEGSEGSEDKEHLEIPA